MNLQNCATLTDFELARAWFRNKGHLLEKRRVQNFMVMLYDVVIKVFLAYGFCYIHLEYILLETVVQIFASSASAR